MMHNPHQALQELEAAVRAMKRQLIDAAHAEGGGKPMVGSYLANGQPSAGALGGTLPSTALTGSAPATGDIAYFDGAAWVLLPAGTPGQVLTVDGGGLPSWV